MKSLRIGVVLGIVALAQIMCHQAILVAPPGSSLTLIPNPTFIAAHGDTSLVLAIVYDPTGNPVADGTVVQFFTNLGRIPEQAKTNDGVAQVFFTSDTRSGTATLTAISGGGTTGGTSPTPTTGPGGGGPAQSTGDLRAASTLSELDAAGALNRGTATITIGSARPHRVDVTADPARLTDSRTSQIVATVYDTTGNPVQNVPVIFRSENPLLGTMDSGGAPVHTDNSGRARDVFRTRIARGDPTVRARVFAQTPTGVTGETIVQIN